MNPPAAIQALSRYRQVIWKKEGKSQLLSRHRSTALHPPTDVQICTMMILLVVAFASSLVTASQLVLAKQPAVGNVAYTLPTARTFLLNVPAAYSHGMPHPLVLSFHGGNSRLANHDRAVELKDYFVM